MNKVQDSIIDKSEQLLPDTQIARIILALN